MSRACEPTSPQASIYAHVTTALESQSTYAISPKDSSSENPTGNHYGFSDVYVSF